jgi:hypothetical protein
MVPEKGKEEKQIYLMLGNTKNTTSIMNEQQMYYLMLGENPFL